MSSIRDIEYKENHYIIYHCKNCIDYYRETETNWIYLLMHTVSSKK